MKIAVISCIHGNIEALDAVLLDIDNHSCDKIFSLGDLVGYGPFPNEVVEKIRALNIPSCVGCWDEDIIEGLNACECSHPSLLAEKRGLRAHEWTNKQIKPENREFLATLPHTLNYENLAFVHGSPHSNHEYLLPELDAFVALERVLSSGVDVLFCGHTHVPYVRKLDATNLHFSLVNDKKQENRNFTANLKQIINAGSVGEPRHGRPNATYVIYDIDTQISPHIINAHPRKIIGVGNVGRTPGQASYTIYNPNTNQVDFKTVYYANNKGFNAQPMPRAGNKVM